MNKIFFAIPFLTLPLSSYALTCVGNLTKVETLYTGVVRIVTTSGTPSKSYLCNTNGSWGGVSSETCKTWISYAQVAQTSGQKLEVTYNDVPETSCSELPINSVSHVPFSVGLAKQ